MSESRMRIIDCCSYALLMIGAINFGLMGLFGFNLIAGIFGFMTMPTRVIYCAIGLAAIYDLVEVKAIWKRWEVQLHTPVRVKA